MTEEDRLRNLEEKRRRFGFLSALMMLFCFGIVLGTIYVEHRPFQYTQSYSSLMNILQKEIILNINNSNQIWPWLDQVITSVGGKAISSVNANCAYSNFNSQIVTINSKQYTLEYPYIHMESCSEENLDFIQGSSDEVYLIGNHQLLVFGLFSQRGTPRKPLHKSVKDNEKSLIEVRRGQSGQLDPLSDEKIVEICRVNWTQTVETATADSPEVSYCLLKDAFENHFGSTFDWSGMEVEGQLAYEEGSSAFVVSSELSSGPIHLLPCYSYRDTLLPTSSPTPVPTVPSVQVVSFSSSLTIAGLTPSYLDAPTQSALLLVLSSLSQTHNSTASPTDTDWTFRIDQITSTSSSPVSGSRRALSSVSSESTESTDVIFTAETVLSSHSSLSSAADTAVTAIQEQLSSSSGITSQEFISSFLSQCETEGSATVNSNTSLEFTEVRFGNVTVVTVATETPSRAPSPAPTRLSSEKEQGLPTLTPSPSLIGSGFGSAPSSAPSPASVPETSPSSSSPPPDSDSGSPPSALSVAPSLAPSPASDFGSPPSPVLGSVSPSLAPSLAVGPSSSPGTESGNTSLSPSSAPSPQGAPGFPVSPPSPIAGSISPSPVPSLSPSLPGTTAPSASSSENGNGNSQTSPPDPALGSSPIPSPSASSLPSSTPSSLPSLQATPASTPASFSPPSPAAPSPGPGSDSNSVPPTCVPSSAPSLAPTLHPVLATTSSPSPPPSLPATTPPFPVSPPTDSVSSTSLPSLIPSSVPSVGPTALPSSTSSASAPFPPPALGSVFPSSAPSAAPSLQGTPGSYSDSVTPTMVPSSSPSSPSSPSPSSSPSTAPSVPPSTALSTAPSPASPAAVDPPSAIDSGSSTSAPSAALQGTPASPPSSAPSPATAPPPTLGSVSPSSAPSDTPSPPAPTAVGSLPPTIAPPSPPSPSPSLAPTTAPSLQGTPAPPPNPKPLTVTQLRRRLSEAHRTQRHHSARRSHLRRQAALASATAASASASALASAVSQTSESAGRYTLIPGNTSASDSTATMSLSDCQPIWLTSGYDLRVSCYDLLATQPSPSLAFLARSQYHFDEVSSLYDLFFGCDHLTEQSSLSLDTFFVHSPTALESSLHGGLSHGVFLSTENQQKWLLQSTSALLQLRSHHFLDENTLRLTAFFITRSLGKEQLFYSMNQITITLAIQGEISADIQTIFVPIVGYQYGSAYGGEYPWLFQDVLILEAILAALLGLFTIRETYQLILWRLIPLSRWLFSSSSSSNSANSSSSSCSPLSLSPPPPLPPPNTSASAASAADGNPSGQASGRRQSIVKTLTTQMQRVESYLNDDNNSSDGDGNGNGDKEEEDEEVYHTDGKVYHDFLDWLTVFAILLRGFYRLRYLREASSFHSFLISLEEEHSFSSHTKTIATFFLTLQSIDESLHLLSFVVVFVVTLQFFRYLSYDPRCRIIVTTVQTSLSGLIPVLVIFLVILIAYAILASGIYGIVIPQYATYASTLAALAVMLLGEWDYDSLIAVSSVETLIFFWSFVVVISFILLNMVIAIIFTTYDQIAEKTRERKLASEEKKKRKLMKHKLE